MSEVQSQIFFPLRSNIGWFQTADLKKEITDQIKKALLIYDKLYFEDGTFVADILERASTSFYLPPGQIPNEQRIIVDNRDFRPTNMTLAVGSDGGPPRNIFLQGRTVARFKIDYYDILKDIDASEYKCIEHITIDSDNFPQEAKTVITQQSFRDRTTFNDIHPNIFLRSLIIKNLNRDLITSILLGTSVILDHRNQSILRKKCQLPEESCRFIPNCNGIALAHLLTIAAPNFSSLTIEEVINLRQEPLWVTFRKFLYGLTSTIQISPDVLVNSNALKELVERKVNQALFEELKRKYPTGVKIGIDLGLGLAGFIPGFGIIPGTIGVGKTTYEAFKGKTGWFAFLLRVEP